MTADAGYVEASTPLGVVLIAVGLAVEAAHATLSIFTGWGPAIVLGALWVMLGAMLLFPDVRLYQYEQSPVERLLLEWDEQ